MKFTSKTLDPVTTLTQCAIVPVFEGGKLSSSARAINSASGGSLKALLKREDISGKHGESVLLPLIDSVKAERVLLVGCGPKGKMSEAQFNTLLGKITHLIKGKKLEKITVFFDELSVAGKDRNWQAQRVATTLALSSYHFDQFKSKRTRHKSLKQVTYASSSQAYNRGLNQALTTGLAIAKGMGVARDLGNMPGNACTPNYLASEARKLARKHPALSSRILSEKQMQDLGMGSFLSVTAGTVEPARMIVMQYQGAAKSQRPHILVGKGITFDSGGISLKPGAGMDEMKFDMCGAASVFGVLNTVLALKLPINLVCIVAAAENMPSGQATKPGDIVTSMSGQTIEVLNTDAEGRLVLCDALTYAEQFKPQSVIDIATLTGACVVALGNHAHGLYSNDDKLAGELLDCGQAVNDKAWHMPLWPEYDKQLKSNFADMANIGGRNAGSVTAACFLARFTKKYAWAHLDIAGTAWNSGGNKGATGRPVALLSEYLIRQSGKGRRGGKKTSR